MQIVCIEKANHLLYVIPTNTPLTYGTKIIFPFIQKRHHYGQLAITSYIHSPSFPSLFYHTLLVWSCRLVCLQPSSSFWWRDTADIVPKSGHMGDLGWQCRCFCKKNRDEPKKKSKVYTYVFYWHTRLLQLKSAWRDFNKSSFWQKSVGKLAFQDS